MERITESYVGVAIVTVVTMNVCGETKNLYTLMHGRT